MSEERKPPTWRVVIAYILDVFTVFFGFGFLIGWLTGGLTGNGFQLNGLPAFVMFALIIAYFVICHRWLRGTLWRHILGVPRPAAES
ncbi:hypothetical protein [Inquilinus limosus]|uniref:RDD domain-containing protein n=1 Tax=Inquilinus limosus MP06 TaxID=1398085 RepID=A0A0A0DAE4_9PROT|nr:hypothetical protein [Inquilinus limosus]KGM33927.1 hypothetical protein P409_13160 [Inquilinus limosus MP06]